MARSHSAIASGLIQIGFSKDFADAVDVVIADDELLDFVYPDEFDDELPGDESQTTIIYRTQQDSKVDDRICLPQEGDVYDLFDSSRPLIPDDNHPNCRCYWEDADTGENLGQF